MKLTDRIRPFLLRWEWLLALTAIILPVLAASLAGFAWMFERGVLITFIVATISFSGLIGLTRFAVFRWRRRSSGTVARPPARLHARIDPDWSDDEKHALAVARAFIDEKTAAALPWDQFRPVAEEMVGRVANASGKQGKGMMDFTIPEALLLIDRVSIRLRADMRDHVPFADSVSIGTLYWLWQHREVARKVKSHGTTAWRVLRLIKSLPIAVLREIEGAIAEGHSSFVTGEGTAVLQALLLEEVAAAAVDLYSGNLRFSDAELLELGLASGEEDLARRAAAAGPLRIAVVGQISAGKSSLVNALLASNLAETDVIPTTDRAKSYPADCNGVPSVLVDMQGLDGSKRVTDTVLAELQRADLVIWTIRANRPAREIDRASIAQFYKFFEDQPARRMPPMIFVITCIDEILRDWPLPENVLTDEAMAVVTDIVAAVTREIGQPRIHPVPAVLTEPDWNVATLRERVDSYVGEALMTQRNRLRVESQKTGLLRETARARRGLSQAIAAFGPRVLGRNDDNT